MTPQRLEIMKATAESWDASNPFKQQLLDRLAAMGGQHRPSLTSDRQTRRDDVMVEMLKETAEAKQEPSCAF